MDCVSRTVTVLRIIKNHFRAHTKANCIVDIGVECLLTPRKLLPQCNTFCSICVKARSSLLRLIVYKGLCDPSSIIIDPMIFTRPQKSMLALQS